jgi:hypothetical protein
MVELKELNDEQALVAGVAVFVDGRDLLRNPPEPDETLVQIGVGARSLDYAIRIWINTRFRRPRGLSLLLSGDLEVGMTWSAFVEKALS